MPSDIPNLDELSREAIERLQLMRARQYFAEMAAKRTMLPSGMVASDLSGIDDITRYPFMTGQQLAMFSDGAVGLAFRRDSTRGGVVMKSGGSTGARKLVVHSWESFKMAMALGARGISNRSDVPVRVVNCLASGSLWGGFIFGQGIAECLGALLYPTGTGMPHPELASLIESERIDTMLASPSVALSFVTNPVINSASLASLQRILYIGEAATPSIVRQITARAPWIKVRSLAYTSQETGPLAYQCHAQEAGVHHVHEDAVFLELIVDGPAGYRAASLEEPGEVVVTPFGMAGNNLVRYRMNDLAREIKTPCPCGSQARVIELLGRADVSAKVCGYMVSHIDIAEALAPLAKIEVGDVQIIVRRLLGKARVEVVLARERVDAVAVGDAAKAVMEETQIGSIAKLTFVESVEVVVRALREFDRAPETGKSKFLLEYGE